MIAVVRKGEFIYGTVKKLAVGAGFKHFKETDEHIVVADTKEELERGILIALEQEKKDEG